jgi:hypothetical protein
LSPYFHLPNIYNFGADGMSRLGLVIQEQIGLGISGKLNPEYEDSFLRSCDRDAHIMHAERNENHWNY